MSADPRVIRAYRRLVRIYPPGARRAELLDTLLECAPAGRRRPSPREIVNLARHGVRARLGRPGSRGVVVLAVLIALAAAFPGAAAANRLGWNAAGPLPGATLERIVFPGLTVWGGGDAAKIVTQSDGDGVEYGYAISWVRHTAATRDVDGYTAAVRARLEAAGWTVTAVDPPPDETGVVGADPGDRAAGFTAERGTLAIHFTDYLWPGRPSYDSDGSASYSVWHLPPPWLTGLTWAGAVLAGALAWLLTGWVSRRLEGRPGASRMAAIGAGCCVTGVLPAVLMGVPSDGSADETVAPFWQGLVYFASGPAVLAGALAVLIVAAAAMVEPPRVLRRRRAAVLTALVATGAVLLALGPYRVGVGRLVAGSCEPAAPAGIQDPPAARLSYLSRVFIDPQTTPDQRNLVQAAIWRGFGGALTFNGGPRSDGFTEAFCAHARVPAGLAATLPWYWTVELASPGLFGGLAAEVATLPGVVAVQHVPGD